MLYRITQCGVPPLHWSKNIALYTIFPKQRVKNTSGHCKLCLYWYSGKNPRIMITFWQLFTDLSEAVKPWALLFGEQSWEEKVKVKMTEEVNPKAYPLAEQVCFFSMLIAPGPPAPPRSTNTSSSGAHHQDPQSCPAGCQLQAAAQGNSYFAFC